MIAESAALTPSAPSDRFSSKQNSIIEVIVVRHYVDVGQRGKALRDLMRAIIENSRLNCISEKWLTLDSMALQ
jgi:hypothetical protein